MSIDREAEVAETDPPTDAHNGPHGSAPTPAVLPADPEPTPEGVEGAVVDLEHGSPSHHSTDRAPSRFAAKLPSRIILLVTLVVSALVVALLALIVWMSIRGDSTALGPTTDVTLERFPELLTAPNARDAAINTAIFAAWAVFWALLFGVTIAWLVERTDLGGRTVIYTLMTVSILIPGFFTAMGWTFLAHPRIGLLNEWARDIFGIDRHIFNVTSLAGMGWVQGLSLTSIVFVLTASSLRTMDASLEESAAMSGAGFLSTMRRITIPLVKPGLLGAAIFALTIAIATFDIPLLIGASNRVIVFSTFLYARTQPADGGIPEYGLAAAFSVLMIVVGLLLSWTYGRTIRQARNYQIVTGKNYKPRLVELGRWKWPARGLILLFMMLKIGLPLVSTVWASLIPFLQLPSRESWSRVSLDHYRDLDIPMLSTSLKNTALLMLLAPTFAVLVALCFSWVVIRTRMRARVALDYVAFLTQAVPTIVFAFAAFIFTVRTTKPIDLYGSMSVIVVMVVINNLAFATRMTNSSFIQISEEIEEAATMSGASTFTVLRKITIPLIRPALFMAWLWTAMIAFRELTVPTILFARSNQTLSVMVWNFWNHGDVGAASAVTLIMLAALFPLVALYWYYSNRRSRQGRGSGGILS